MHDPVEYEGDNRGYHPWVCIQEEELETVQIKFARGKSWGKHRTHMSASPTNRRVLDLPSVGPSADATAHSVTAEFLPGCISPCGVLLFGILVETVSSLPGWCDERSHCSLTGPHTGSDPDDSEGEIYR